jgi:hypothetical protein
MLFSQLDRLSGIRDAWAIVQPARGHLLEQSRRAGMRPAVWVPSEAEMPETLGVSCNSLQVRERMAIACQW